MLKIRNKGVECMDTVNTIAKVLVIIGGLNWGLVGFFQYNLVDQLFGVDSVVARVVYVLVGLAALYMIFGLFKANETTKTNA